MLSEFQGILSGNAPDHLLSHMRVLSSSSSLKTHVTFLPGIHTAHIAHLLLDSRIRLIMVFQNMVVEWQQPGG